MHFSKMKKKKKSMVPRNISEEANETKGSCMYCVMSINDNIGQKRRWKRELLFPTGLQGACTTSCLVVTDCMETSLPLKAWRISKLVD